MLQSNKKGDFDFEWLFAIVAGAIILMLAIYGVSKIGDAQRYTTDSGVAKQLTILTDPLQAGFADGSYGKVIFNQESRINNKCDNVGFGTNSISISTRSSVGEEWKRPGAATSTAKYIFSSNLQQGKEFYVFSKSFNMPFKVADLLFVNSKKYCFVTSSETSAIENELNGLNMGNIEVGSRNNCSDDSIKVCFNSRCNISIYGNCDSSGCNSVFDEGYVEKDGKRFNYVGSLMYAAIFSDYDIYNCNVKRLIYRTANIAKVYAKKADLMNSRDCNTNLQSDMEFLASVINSSDLDSVNSIAKGIELKNGELCGLY